MHQSATVSNILQRASKEYAKLKAKQQARKAGSQSSFRKQASASFRLRTAKSQLATSVRQFPHEEPARQMEPVFGKPKPRSNKRKCDAEVVVSTMSSTPPHRYVKFDRPTPDACAARKRRRFMPKDESAAHEQSMAVRKIESMPPITLKPGAVRSDKQKNDRKHSIADCEQQILPPSVQKEQLAGLNQKKKPPKESGADDLRKRRPSIAQVSALADPQKQKSKPKALVVDREGKHGPAPAPGTGKHIDKKKRYHRESAMDLKPKHASDLPQKDRAVRTAKKSTGRQKPVSTEVARKVLAHVDKKCNLQTERAVSRRNGHEAAKHCDEPHSKENQTGCKKPLACEESVCAKSANSGERKQNDVIQVQHKSSRKFVLLLSSSSQNVFTASQRNRIQTMGATFLSDEDDAATATHVIVTGGALRRTARVMCAICRGQKIIKLDWLCECARAGRWISEVGYELTSQRMAAPKASSTPMPQKRTGTLLAGRSVYVYPSVAEHAVLESIVAAAGGTVLRTRHHAGEALLIGSVADRPTVGNRTLHSPELIFEAAMTQKLCESGHRL